MGNEHEIDTLFREELAEGNIPTIPQAYLDDLNRRLDDYAAQSGKSTQGGKSTWKWWVSAAAGIVAVGALYVLNKNAEFKPEKEVEFVQEKQVQQEITVDVAKSEFIETPVISNSDKTTFSKDITEKTKNVEVSSTPYGNKFTASKVKDMEMLGVVSGSIKYVVHSSGSNIIDRSADFSSLTFKKQLTKGQIQKNIHNIDLYSKIIEGNPYDEYAYCNRGVSKEVLKDYKGAVADYSKVIKLNPKFVNAYYNRANALVKLKDYKAAINDFTKAIELDPNFAEAYNNRGFAYEVIQKSKEALKDYTQAIALNPNYIEAYYNRGVSYESVKDKKAAVADYNKVLELNPSVEEAYYNRGFIKIQFEDYQGAISDFTKAIEINPQNGNSYIQRGYVKRALKDIDGACADWSKASELGAMSVDLVSEFCK
jgi:tetratricopeptide (TPR) repeat protein